jgi:hypothetical protein
VVAAVTRLVVYGILAIFTTLLLADTNIGWPASRDQLAEVRTALDHIKRCKVDRDAKVLTEIANFDGIRYSKIFSFITRASSRHGDQKLAYYAYTPILSGRRIFLGDIFSDIGTVGRASILSHETQHLVRHRERLLGGYPRRLDEAAAYEHQYLTYRDLGLDPSGMDGIVYWDMMIGLEFYLIPVRPKCAQRPDIKAAQKQLDDYEE